MALWKFWKKARGVLKERLNGWSLKSSGWPGSGFSRRVIFFTGRKEISGGSKT
jgi:hypothetical protein